MFPLLFIHTCLSRMAGEEPGRPKHSKGVASDHWTRNLIDLNPVIHPSSRAENKKVYLAWNTDVWRDCVGNRSLVSPHTVETGNTHNRSWTPLGILCKVSPSLFRLWSCTAPHVLCASCWAWHPTHVQSMTHHVRRVSLWLSEFWALRKSFSCIK